MPSRHRKAEARPRNMSDSSSRSPSAMARFETRSHRQVCGGRPWHPQQNDLLTSQSSGRASRAAHRGVSQTAMGSTSAGGIEVATANRVDDELVAAFNRLVPQLSRSAAVPTPDLIREIVEAQASMVLVARDRRDDGRIVGMLTLVIFRIPTGVRAWIEDVVVDEAVRGRGVGEALSQEAVRRAVGLGARTVELTSRPSREAANRLYERLGFVRRDSHL